MGLVYCNICLLQGNIGTVLWPSRDRRIADLVGPSQAIEVAPMTQGAVPLLGTGSRLRSPPTAATF
jgi:hypothetical protein